MTASGIDVILEKLAKDVEASVHSLYRGEVRGETVKTHTGHLLQEARDALAKFVKHGADVAGPGASDEFGAVSPRPSVAAPVVAGVDLGWTGDDSEAVMRCINAWLPMGAPTSTPPDAKCIAAGKMLIPSWGERERAREAVRRLARP